MKMAKICDFQEQFCMQSGKSLMIIDKFSIGIRNRDVFFGHKLPRIHPWIPF